MECAKIKDVKILTLCYEYPPIGGGGGKVVEGLSQALVQQGEQVDVLTMHYGDLPYQREIDGVRVFGVPCLRLRKEICTPLEMGTYLISALPAAKRLIKQNHYDLIQSHFIFPDGGLAYWLKKTTHLPYMVTAHGSDVPGYNPNRFQIEHIFLLPLWRKILQDASFTVAASQGLAHLIQQSLPSHPVEQIYNAFTPPPLQTDHKDPLHIVAVSRLFERKGIQYLLQALEGETTPYQVDIIGSGPYQPELEKQAQRMKTAATITFHGWLDQADPRFWQLMESAAVFVFPSEKENFPMVLLEAMAAQMAIITTDDSGCAEVVGDAAIVVPKRDGKAIQQALQRLRENPNQLTELSQLARTRLTDQFNWIQMAKQYQHLYQQIGKDKDINSN